MAKTKLPAATKSDVPPDEPVVTPMQLLVKELFADLEAIQAKIPNFQYPHPRTRKLVRTYRSVPRAFIQEMNDSVKMEPELQAFGIYDPEAGAEALDFTDNLKIFRGAVNRFLVGLSFTIEFRHGELAEKALQTYQISKALRRRQGSNLGSHVTRLREALNRAGRKRGKRKQE